MAVVVAEAVYGRGLVPVTVQLVAMLRTITLTEGGFQHIRSIREPGLSGAGLKVTWRRTHSSQAQPPPFPTAAP
jgi:hypothetical protein